MTRKRSIDEKEIPIHLVPFIIAEHIRRIGDRVHRISVSRSHWHHYNISVRTKTFRKELAPVQNPEEEKVPAMVKRSRRRGCVA